MKKTLGGLAAFAGVLAVTGFAAAQERSPVAFEAVAPPAGLDPARLEALAAATRFSDWPRVGTLAVAPEVSRSLLARAQLVTRETVQFEVARLAGEEWGVLRVSWQNLTGAEPSAGAELTPAVREKELHRLSKAQRADLTTLEAYLARRLERQRASAGRRLEGELAVELALGPSARAAQEYLLQRMAGNMLPAEVLGSAYRGASTPEGLGDRGWVVESRSGKEVRIDLVRRNVALIVTARGSLAEEALGLARRLDGSVERQPPRTLEQLRALRPSVTLAAQPAGGALNYSVSLPEGSQIGAVLAAVDGVRVSARDGAVPVAGRGRVRVTVVTRELLAASAEAAVGRE